MDDCLGVTKLVQPQIWGPACLDNISDGFHCIPYWAHPENHTTMFTHHSESQMMVCMCDWLIDWFQDKYLYLAHLRQTVVSNQCSDKVKQGLAKTTYWLPLFTSTNMWAALEDRCINKYGERWPVYIQGLLLFYFTTLSWQCVEIWVACHIH